MLDTGMTVGQVNTVRTTGIYCRAGCAGRPLLRNTAIVASPAAAEALGYRPCLRCRPDALPVAVLHATTPAPVRQALRHIGEGFLDRADEAALARLVGVSGRHLRRLFLEEIGATPSQVARSRRAHFARRLLDDTDLSITEIAFAAGFGSVRAMNDVMRRTFRRPPGELRARRGSVPDAVDGGLRLRLVTERPIDGTGLLAAVAGQAVAGVESVDVSAGRYCRTTTVCGHPGVVELQLGGDSGPRRDGCTVAVTLHLPSFAGLIDEVGRCRRLLRLDEADAIGPPGPWDHFEGDVRALVATALGPSRAGGALAMLAGLLGAPVPGASGLGLDRTFPSPAAVAGVDPAVLRGAGLSDEAAGALVALAAAAGAGAGAPAPAPACPAGGR